MVKVSSIFSRNIGLTDADFNIDKVYKSVKKKVDSLGYGFAEKEQTSKPTKYGEEIKFTFAVYKEFDDFATGEINIEFFFDGLKRSKSGDHGNANVSIKAKLLTDFKNQWGKTPFNIFMFKIYSKIKKKEFEKKYIGPLWAAATGIDSAIKEAFGLELS